MFDFFKRKPAAKPASRAVVTSDPKADSLRAEVAAKQWRAAELEADLMESRESLAAFQREFEARLGPYLQRAAQLQEQIKAARKAAFRNFRELTIENCGHMMHHDQPQQLAAVIEQFLAQP